MKQKFYSQVNMESIFFFLRPAFPVGRGAPAREELMRFGIIGAGRIGRIHGANVAARRDSQVLYVADADPAAAAALAGPMDAKGAAIDEILPSPAVGACRICLATDP